jgi:lariat debranching enzyme
VLCFDCFAYRVDRFDVKEDREWVKNRLDERGRKPFHFVQSIQPFNPSQHISNPSPTSKFLKPFL